MTGPTTFPTAVLTRANRPPSPALTAAADSDPNGRYFPQLETDPGAAGIADTGSAGAFAYAVIGPSGLGPPGARSPGNRLISYVSWCNAARFANWLSNGPPPGLATGGAGVADRAQPSAGPLMRQSLPRSLDSREP